MKAVVKYGKGKGLVELREVPEPTIADDEVLIRVEAVSVCGSDLHIYHDAHPYWPPMTLGHEFSGRIERVGAAVSGWKVGDRVVSETRTGSCGECFYCQKGSPQICPRKRPPGIGRDGAYAKYVAMPARLLHRLPDEVSFDEGACVEPTAVCYHGLIERTGVQPGDTVVIMGPGPIGLLSLLLAKNAGASFIVVTGTARSAALKLTKAKEVGADVVVNVAEQSVVDVVMEHTNGLGADVVVECSGSPQAIADAVRVARRHGKICALGISGRENVSFEWDAAVFKGLELIFAFSSSWTSWEAVLRLMAKRQLDVRPLITHVVPLERWQEIFEQMERGQVIKAILRP